MVEYNATPEVKNVPDTKRKGIMSQVRGKLLLIRVDGHSNNSKAFTVVCALVLVVHCI
jgi:hypothetical protein